MIAMLIHMWYSILVLRKKVVNLIELNDTHRAIETRANAKQNEQYPTVRPVTAPEDKGAWIQGSSCSDVRKRLKSNSRYKSARQTQMKRKAARYGDILCKAGNR